MYSITTQARGRALAEQLTSRLGGLLIIVLNPETICLHREEPSGTWVL